MKKAVKIIVFSFLIVLTIGTVLLNVTLYQSESIPFQREEDQLYVKSGDLDIRYRIFGDEDSLYPPVYLLHGFNVAGIKEWEKIEPFLDDRFKYIAFDWPGMGLSSRLSSDLVLDNAFKLSVIEDVITETNPTSESFTLLGASYGATLATAYSEKNTNVLNQLIVISPLYEQQGGGIFSNLSSLPLGLGRGLTFMAMGAGPVGDFLYNNSNMNEHGFKPSEKDIKERKKFAQIKGTTESFMKYSYDQESFDFSVILPNINEKTYAIFGEEDTYQESDYLKKNAIESDVVLKADHTPHLSKPKETAQIVNRLLLNSIK